MDDADYDELTRTLHSDIRALVPLVFPFNRPVSDANIRLIAVILRRWLINGDLKKLLEPLKQSALFEVQGNTLAHAYATRSGAFRYYLTAGVKANGRPVSHIYESLLPPDAIDRSFVREKPSRLPLKKFLAQPRLLYEGYWFTTAQILRFVANKLGGNHLDFDRSGEWERLDAANRFLRYGGPPLAIPPEGTALYLVLEPSSDEIVGGVHLEVIAAAASFVQMEIGGQQLCTLKTEKSLLGKLRKQFRKQPEITLIERPPG